MSETPAVETNKRFRSPPYPSISLSKAIERAKELHNKALHHPVSITVVSDAWDYGVKSSGLWATAAALMQYGLLTDEGTGEKRKFQLTDAAIRIIRDPDAGSEKRRSAIKQAAVTPKIFKELWDSYGTAINTLSDVVFKSHLTVDRRDHGLASYSDTAADEVIRSYRETISFAGLTDTDIIPDTSEEKDGAVQKHDASARVGAPEHEAKKKPPADPPSIGKVRLMENERVVFTEENTPQQYVKLVASGEVDEALLEALQDYVKRQKKRLGIAAKGSETAN